MTNRHYRLPFALPLALSLLLVACGGGSKNAKLKNRVTHEHLAPISAPERAQEAETYREARENRGHASGEEGVTQDPAKWNDQPDRERGLIEVGPVDMLRAVPVVGLVAGNRE